MYLLAERRWRLAALPVVLFATFFCLMWVALGQSPANLSAYLRGSFWLTEGFAAGMGMSCPGPEVPLALAAIAAFFLTLCGRSARSLARPKPIVILLLLGGTLFLQWKLGFVRCDHASASFGFLIVVPFLLPKVFDEYDWRFRPRIVLLIACVVLNAAGLLSTLPADQWVGRTVRRIDTFSDEAWSVVMPLHRRDRLEWSRRKLAERWSLPLTKARAGDSGVDLFSFEQGVLLLNDLHWRPRPVFQSYAAYTEDLLTLNSRFLRSDRAPQFVLFKFEPLDGRFPASVDGRSLLVILRDYRPLFLERNLLLLQRRPTAGGDDPVRRIVQEQTVRFEEEIPLDQSVPGGQTVTLAIEPTWWGILRHALFRSPPVFLHVRTGLGDQRTYQIPVAMARSEFILDPLLHDTQDFLDLYASIAMHRVTSFWLTTDAAGRACYEDRVVVVLREFPISRTGLFPDESVR